MIYYLRDIIKLTLSRINFQTNFENISFLELQNIVQICCLQVIMILQTLLNSDLVYYLQMNETQVWEH